MTIGPVEGRRARPVLFARAGTPRPIPPPTARPSNRTNFPRRGVRIARLDAQLDAAVEALNLQVEIATSIYAADPQLVLVLEALDERVDLVDVAARVGFEVLTEVDHPVEPTQEYNLASRRATDPMLRSCLHAICLNQTAMNELMRLWRLWKRTNSLPTGYTPLRDLFQHLREVRAWGPQDRLKMIDWEERLSQDIQDSYLIDLELWFRASEGARAQAQTDVTALVAAEGGEVLSSAVIPQIGYHGLKCQVPTALLSRLARREFGEVRLVQSASIMYLHVGGQSPALAPPVADDQTPIPVDKQLPSGRPIACLLDGVPAVNHALLDGRVQIFDPDDLQAAAPVEQRRHGTWMASVAAWGDLNNPAPASRPILIRPIMAPSSETLDHREEVPSRELVPDLMWRVFRELFEPGDNQQAIEATAEVVVVNLSVGDPAAPFDSILSSWARMIDWLSYRYGVLVIVSAGNQAQLPVAPLTVREVLQQHGEDRRETFIHAQHADHMNRRLISPSEAINALTIGATHSDESRQSPVGYAHDPADGLPCLSPISRMGGGYRRSVKPELTAPGGRVFFREGFGDSDVVKFAELSPLGPGIRVATTSSTSQETHIFGTSPAAVMATRTAARLAESLDEITGGVSLSRRQRAVAVKALLIHGTDLPPDHGLEIGDWLRATGYGTLTRDLADGCAGNEAVVLYLGQISKNQEIEISMPLADGLGTRDVKRIAATLAWLSPINWRHRQYRSASLSFSKPRGGIPILERPIFASSDAAKRGAATVQHLAWETPKAFAGGRGSLIDLHVQCREQTGRPDLEPVDFAVALSLWVAPSVNVNLYDQVREQLRTRVAVQPN